jgi:hypothetical protein
MILLCGTAVLVNQYNWIRLGGPSFSTCRISYHSYDFDVPQIQRSTGWIIAPLVLSKHLIAEATHSSISPFSTGQLQFLKLNSHNPSYDAA